MNAIWCLQATVIDCTSQNDTCQVYGTSTEHSSRALRRSKDTAFLIKDLLALCTGSCPDLGVPDEQSSGGQIQGLSRDACQSAEALGLAPGHLVFLSCEWRCPGSVTTMLFI